LERNKLQKEYESINSDDFKNHSFLSEELLVPNLNKTDGSRINMFCSHLLQNVTLKSAEIPRVFTGFENQVGIYSSSYKKANADFKIIKIIHKNKLNRLYVIQYLESKMYDILEVKYATNITESYGYAIHDKIQNHEEGSVVKKDSLIFRSDMHDDNLNLRFGINLKAAFMAYKGLTTEDAIVISRSAANRLTTYSIEEVTINVNDNDILCNIYGNNSKYRAFPKIGGLVKDQILVARRRQINDSILFDGNFDNLNKVNFSTDTLFYSEGMLIDVDIFCNNPNLKDLEDLPYYRQILKSYELQQKYYNEINDTLSPIVNEKSNTFSGDLSYIYKRAKDILDPNIKFKSSDKNDFSNFLIRFFVLKEKSAVIGSKITNRFGKPNI
jgi:DNA-directed RNA polymerase beta subunit